MKAKEFGWENRLLQDVVYVVGTSRLLLGMLGTREKVMGFAETGFVGAMSGKPVPDTPLGRRAERIYRMYPQYFDSPREVYLMLRWKLIYDYMPDDLIAKHLIELKKNREGRIGDSIGV